MAVNSTVRTAGPYLGTGLVATYPFSFKVFQASDVLVVETVGSVQTTMTLTTDYTVSLNVDQNNNPGGSITLTAGNLPSTTTLTMTSQVPQTQGQTIANFSGFLPSVLTDAYDKLTILVQQLAQLLGRGITFPISDGTSLNTQLPVASARANQYMSFDVLGNVTTSSGLSSVPVSTPMVPVVGAATLGYAEQLLAQGNIASAAVGFVDTNVLEQSTFGANSYVQDVTQNTSSDGAASADIVVANNLATATTFYGNFGMNSSGFTGTGNFNKANAVYLSATSGDLVVGTTTANAIHFVYNNGATDSAFIDSTGLNAVNVSASNVSASNVLASSSMKLNGSPVFDRINVYKFTSSGVYTPSTGTVYAIIECVGGGGGGGGVSGGGASQVNSGGGGGSGGYSRKFVAITPSNPQTFTIGAGGAGNSGAAGSNGGTTSVGSLCIANGGSGGANGTGTAVGAGGAGGTAGTGDITTTGNYGGSTLSLSSGVVQYAGSPGANSIFGGGANGVIISTGVFNGYTATGNGAGGGGAVGYNSASVATGGAGTGGIVIVTEFISF